MLCLYRVCVLCLCLHHAARQFVLIGALWALLCSNSGFSPPGAIVSEAKHAAACGNFDIILDHVADAFLGSIPHAMGCAVRIARSDRVLFGACNPSVVWCLLSDVLTDPRAHCTPIPIQVRLRREGWRRGRPVAADAARHLYDTVTAHSTQHTAHSTVTAQLQHTAHSTQHTAHSHNTYHTAHSTQPQLTATATAHSRSIQSIVPATYFNLLLHSGVFFVFLSPACSIWIWSHHGYSIAMLGTTPMHLGTL